MKPGKRKPKPGWLLYYITETYHLKSISEKREIDSGSVNSMKVWDRRLKAEGLKPGWLLYYITETYHLKSISGARGQVRASSGEI